jgi:hypothetical protein
VKVHAGLWAKNICAVKKILDNTLSQKRFFDYAQKGKKFGGKGE